MTDNKELNPFEGFKALEGDTMPPSDLEIKDVADVDTMGEDTGIVDKTKEEDTVEETPAKEKKDELSVDNLEIEYRDTVEEDDEEVTESEPKEEAEATKTEEEEEELSQIGILANHLKEEGVIDFEDEEFEDSEEGLANVVKKQIEKGVAEYK